MPNRGDVREDGRIFWGYNKRKEDWRDPDAFNLAVEKRRERNRRLKRTRGRWLDLYKQAKGCEECGYKGNAKALQFDHLDRSEKHLEISNMKNYNLKRLFEEIRKCRILCANCHHIHSDNQRKEDECTDV